MRRHTPERGFTLVEALIAIAITASLAVLMVSTVRGAVIAQAGVARGVGDSEDRALVNETVRDVLRFAYSGPRAASEFAFSGDSYGFRVLTQPPGRPAPMLASLTVEGEGLVLALSDTATGTGDSVTLATDAARVSIRYFARATPGRPGGWFSEWREEEPPNLVRLDFISRRGEAWRIEALVGGDATLDCPFDSGNGICLDTRGGE